MSLFYHRGSWDCYKVKSEFAVLISCLLSVIGLSDFLLGKQLQSIIA